MSLAELEPLTAKGLWDESNVSRGKKGTSKGGQFTKKGGGGGGKPSQAAQEQAQAERDALKAKQDAEREAQQAAHEDERNVERTAIEAEQAAERVRIEGETEQNRQAAEQARAAERDAQEKLKAKRQAEDAVRKTQRVREDVAIAAKARQAAQDRAAAAKEVAAVDKDLADATKKRQGVAAQLARLQESAKGAKSGTYDAAIAQYQRQLEGLQADEDAKRQVSDATHAKAGEIPTADRLAELRDQVRLSRSDEDVATSAQRASEDEVARATSENLRQRIADAQRSQAQAHAAQRRSTAAQQAQRRRATSARQTAERRALAAQHAQQRKEQTAAQTARKKGVSGSLTAAAVRDRRRRMLLRAAITTNRHERAVLQASAAALLADLRAAVTVVDDLPDDETDESDDGEESDPGDFDGAALVLLADQGEVTYPDGATGPVHVTLAYLGPADELRPFETEAAAATAQTIAARLQPFTPTALSPARFGDTDVLLVEHPDIQWARDVALADPDVAGAVARGESYPHYLPHCAGVDQAPTLNRVGLLVAGDVEEYPFTGPLTAALPHFNADLHPRGKDGKWIEKFGLVDLIDISGFRHGQRGDKRVEGKVTDIIPDPKRPGDPIIRVEMTDPRWDSGKFGKTIDVRRKNVLKRDPAKAVLKGKAPTPVAVTHPTPKPVPNVSADVGVIAPRTPLPAMLAHPNGPNFAPLEPPGNWDQMDEAARTAWLKAQMEADFSAWRGKDTRFEFATFGSGIAFNLANTYRDLANWDPGTAQRLDYLIPSSQSPKGLSKNAIAVAHPGTAHPGGIGPKVEDAGIVLGDKFFQGMGFWTKQQAGSAAMPVPFSMSSQYGDPTLTLVHEFSHQRQFRSLDVAMRDVGQAWSPVVRDDGFGLIPDSSNWPETQALRYAIPKQVSTKYGQSKSSEGFAEAWTSRLTGDSSDQLNGTLDAWDGLMHVAEGLPTDRFDATTSFDELTPEQVDQFWTDNGPRLDLPGMRQHYPETAAAYDAWQAEKAATPAPREAPTPPRAAPAAPDLPEQDVLTPPPTAPAGTREAGNVYVGEQVLLPGDLIGTVTDLESLNGDWMRLHTDMGTLDLRMSDPIQVIP